MLNRWAALMVVVGLFVGRLDASAQIPAFPGAEGFGAISVGGRGGDVYHVTSLADTNTLGTLRHAISSAPGSGRTVVFDISGNIQLNSDLSVNNPRITIAGQTAPGQGITLSGDSVWLENDDLVVRYIRSRLTSTGGTQDSLSIQDGNRVVIDHSSASWSADEITSMTHNSTDNTIQWSLITEALNVQNHSRASLFRPGADVGAPFAYNLSVHHSLYAHSSDRNPVFATYNDKVLNADFRNNVVFDWRNQATHTGDVESNVNLNFVSNYYVAGLTTRADLVANPTIFGSGSTDTVIYYNDDNLVDATRDDGLHNGVWDPTAIGGARVEVGTPFNYPAVTTQSASDAYDSVLDFAGSFWWNRDPVDDRVITDVYEISDPDPAVRAMSGMMITTEADVGGLPVLPVISRAADWDTDSDGMPDHWEIEHGLDPNTGGAAQYNGDFDGDGYTNVEEYINDLGAFPCPQEIVFSGATNSRYAQITNWDITWQPSRFDEAQINSGTVVVDAVGQHAGTLKIGAVPGSATLDITGGWLKVEDAGAGLSTGEVIIGADPAATATLNLSGGLLRTETLSKGAGDTFNFTGGVLIADEVNFDLVNNGGIIAPGQSPGQTHVVGDLTINSGLVSIELVSLLDFDRIQVDDAATLGGDLSFSLVGSYLPSPSDVFEILTADTLSGMFANAAATVASGDGVFDVTYTGTSVLLSNFVPSVGLLGDYNRNGVVDAADYTVWRDALSAPGTPIFNDPTPGMVDESDFLYWREHFGDTLGSGQGLAGVPEPASISLAALCLLMVFAKGARAGQVREIEAL